MTKSDKCWNQLFVKYPILEEINKTGRYIINTKQIKEYGETFHDVSFDAQKKLPQIFKKNNLSILPISNKEYIISKTNAYHKLEKANDTITYMKKPDLESLQLPIKSEEMAINYAIATGIFNDFLGENELASTVSGKQSSESLNYSIKNENGLLNVQLKNMQIEVDAGLEGDSLNIIEAKRGNREDFIIRQLYYPYRVWEQKIKKKIRTIFFLYKNETFYLYEYQFKDKNLYNSIELVQQKTYKVI